MPLYEFVCQNCSREQELLVRDEQSQRCESCGSTRLTRLLSVPAAHSVGERVGQNTSLGSNGQPGPCGSSCGCYPG